MDTSQRTVEAEEGADFLASLEDRIRKAVQVVAALRDENDTLRAKLEAAHSSQETTRIEWADAQEQIAALVKELDSMRTERKQVRVRIEKLLGQMDALSGN